MSVLGQELIAKYIDLILKCDSPSAREEIMKLVRWKDSRELFWAEEEEQISVKEYDDKTVRLSSESQAMDIEVHSLPTEEDENADDRRDSIFVQGDIF